MNAIAQFHLLVIQFSFLGRNSRKFTVSGIVALQKNIFRPDVFGLVQRIMSCDTEKRLRIVKGETL